MFSFDSLSLKYFFEENYNFINNAVVQKVQLPTRYEIILTIRNVNTRKLYININPKYPHICFIDEKSSKLRNIVIPKQPPMFCMQLRKYINGSKINNFKLIQYDRILEFYFDYFDEIGSLTKICFCVEFMGKYSNAILYNSKNRIIIGSMHNISSEKSSIREVFGGAKYVYPELNKKFDISKTENVVFNKTNIKDFYYFSQNIIDNLSCFEEDYLKNLVSGKNPEFIVQFWGGGESVSDAIDNYFSKLMFEDIISFKKNKLKKAVKSQIKKANSIKPVDYSSVEKYKQKADYIMANIYDIEKIKDELEDMTPSACAQKYYALYKKKLKTFEYNKKRNDEIKDKINYLEEVMFNIENASDFTELDEIEEEIAFKKEISTKAPSLNKIEYKNYDIYIGKNNIQNNYLLSKIAKPDDLWFHALNCPSSHIILKVPSNKKPPSKDVVEYCAKITKQNSKAKDSSKASIIMTKRKNLKRPPNTYLGYTTYKGEIEIVI